MFKIAEPFFIKVISPLHAGSGQDLGIVDLPIQRERHTGFPKIEASGLKGSIRENFEEIKNDEEKLKELEQNFPTITEKWKIKKKDKTGKEIEEIVKDKNGNDLTKFEQAISLMFGPEEGDAHAGALGFTDARILLFPVKSAKGVFAWITCPSVLKRFKEDLRLCKKNNHINNNFFEENPIPPANTISDSGELVITGTIILEEYAFNVSNNKTTKKFANWLSDLLNIEEIKNKLVVLSDEDFRDFAELSTEVITRTKINNETGTVDKQTGALWTEEYLPSETIMYSFVLANPIFSKDKGIFDKQNKSEEKQILDFWKINMPDVMQIGGNATIGKGIVEIIKYGGTK